LSLNIKPHPACLFCRKNKRPLKFYADDELFEHCTTKHEICFICNQQGIRFQYYRDYSHLEKHFENEHFFCKEVSCRHRKFVVFATQFEYQSHMLLMHQNTLTKEELRNYRRVPVDINFALTNPYAVSIRRNVMREENIISKSQSNIEQPQAHPISRTPSLVITSEERKKPKYRIKK